MKQLSATLTLNVTCDIPDHCMIAQAHFFLNDLLKSIVTHAAINRLFIGDPDLTVADWDSNVVIHPYKPKAQP